MPDLPAPCDLCGQAALYFAYQAERSPRDLKVHVCGHCGLVQSLPRIDRTPTRHGAAVSSGADWGNVRYGKGFRTKAALDALARHVKLDEALALLDVGSNRGSFAKAFLDAAPKANITAVEPDERYADSCAGLPRTKLIWARTEATEFPAASFDIVHSCHTIEHLAAPFAALKDHARVLKQGGLLVLDAPNIALIGGDDIVEEWFIDKHLYHFSKVTLTRLIEAAGFTIIAEPDATDLTNLLFVARKTRAPAVQIAPDAAEAAHAEALIQRYRQTRAANRAALKTVARELNALKPQRVALWGAGRLFDSLVLAGEFDPKALALLIDAHLVRYMPELHGVKLSRPEALSTTRVDVIVAMSRFFSEEIAAEAKRLAPQARVILYSDLLARARLSQAA
jgi:2-polyprenyl-3-methyl-5-hydroxy-6-metoxy-1,4-benzoquinol methylase